MNGLGLLQVGKHMFGLGPVTVVTRSTVALLRMTEFICDISHRTLFNHFCFCPVYPQLYERSVYNSGSTHAWPRAGPLAIVARFGCCLRFLRK